MTKIGNKKRVSKRSKSSWRKHVDITDVEKFLEEQRQDERLGDYSTLSNNELFTLDIEPSNVRKLTSKQAKRLKIRSAPLKCLSSLRPLTKVPDPIAKRNHVKTKEERKSAIQRRRDLLSRANGNFKRSELQSLRDIKKDVEKRKNIDTKYSFKADIWTKDLSELSGNVKFNTQILEDQWITDDAERHLLHGPGKSKKNIPQSINKRPYVINPVEIPHPGMSYNPSLEDHQNLLREVAEVEQKIIKEEEHLDRVTRQMFKKVTPTEKNNNWLIEMSEGLKPDKADANQANDANDGDFNSINPPVKNKEKSTKQKRIKKEQQQLAEQRKQMKIERKKVADIHRLKFINKAIEKREAKSKETHKLYVKKAAEKKKQAKRLGPNKFQEPDLEFNMPADIRGNLRNVKKEGNLLSDRFKSLQKRNVIEPTVRKGRKNAKVKRFVREGFKEDWKSTVAKPKSR